METLDVIVDALVEEHEWDRLRLKKLVDRQKSLIELSTIDPTLIRDMDTHALGKTALQAVSAIPVTKADDDTVSLAIEVARLMIQIVRMHAGVIDPVLGSRIFEVADGIDNCIEHRLTTRDAIRQHTSRARKARAAPDESVFREAFFAALTRFGGPPERGDTEANSHFWETVVNEVVALVGDTWVGSEGPSVRTIQNHCQYNHWLNEWRQARIEA